MVPGGIDCPQSDPAPLAYSIRPISEVDQGRPSVQDHHSMNSKDDGRHVGRLLALERRLGTIRAQSKFEPGPVASTAGRAITDGLESSKNGVASCGIYAQGFIPAVRM